MYDCVASEQYWVLKFAATRGGTVFQNWLGRGFLISYRQVDAPTVSNHKIVMPFVKDHYAFRKLAPCLACFAGLPRDLCHLVLLFVVDTRTSLSEWHECDARLYNHCYTTDTLAPAPVARHVVFFLSCHTPSTSLDSHFQLAFGHPSLAAKQK